MNKYCFFPSLVLCQILTFIVKTLVSLDKRERISEEIEDRSMEFRLILGKKKMTKKNWDWIIRMGGGNKRWLSRKLTQFRISDFIHIIKLKIL